MILNSEVLINIPINKYIYIYIYITILILLLFLGWCYSATIRFNKVDKQSTGKGDNANYWKSRRGILEAIIAW